MRKFLLALLVSGVAFSAHATVNCPRQPHNEHGVLATEHLWVHALQTRDTNLLGCILAPGFMDMAWNHQLRSRDDVLKGLPKRPSNGIKLSKLTVVISNNRAVARGINAATKQDGSLLGRVIFEDMFVYHDGSWRALTAQETLVH